MRKKFEDSLKVFFQFWLCLNFLSCVIAHKFVTCSLKLRFLSFITPRSFSELELSTEQSGNESFVVISKLERKWHLPWLAFMLFSWNHLKSFTDTISNLFSTSHLFFPIGGRCRWWYHQHNLQYLLKQSRRTYRTEIY